MNLPTGASCRPVRLLLLRGAVLLALAWTAAVRAQPIVFTNFSSVGGLTFNSATTATTTADGTVMRLVGLATSPNDRGSAFYGTQMSVSTGFSTAFDFRLSNRGGITDGVQVGGDGFVFTIQRSGVTALGNSGQGMGFESIAPSIGIEFDTYRNSFDPSVVNGGSNHLGVDTAGSVTSLSTANVTIADFDDGTKWRAWIDYNASASTLEVRVSTNGTRPTPANLSYTISPATFASTLGGTSAFVGFTAGTGSANANHDIIAWTFADQFVPGGVTPGLAIPEPSTYALLALGLGVMVAGRRWTRRAR
jgi:hypothetical protein